MDQKAPKAENPSATTPGCSTGDEGATSAIQQSQGSGNMTVLDGQERETGHMDVQECYKDEDVVAFSETETTVTQIAGHSQVSGQGNKVIHIGPNSTVTIFHGTSDDTNTVPSIGSPTEDFPLAHCQDSLRAYFKTRMSYLHPLAWNETFTMKIQDVFTTVDLVTRTQQGGNIERRALPSTVDALSARSDCPQPRRILVEGNAGIGKTTEVSKLAFDWAESEGRSPILEKYDLVFPIALRKVGESQSLAGCIFDQLLPEDVPFQESDLETYLKGNDRVLIILDGFDEWSKHEEHDVTKLLTGKILRECSLLVTTRPSHTPQLHSLMCPDTRVEITGFSQDNIRTYIHRFFKGDQDKAAALTMQEYFAGLYFAKTLQGEPVQQPTLNTYLRTAQSVRDLENVVVFACANWQCFVVPIMDTLKMMNLSELSLRSACLGGHDSNIGPCARLSQQLPHLTDVLVLLPSLKTLVNLEELYLSGNRFAGCGKSLAELPCSLRSLKALKVYKCGLSLEEVLQIVVQHCPKMTEFDYRRNKTGPGGDEKVLAVLRGKWPDATYRRGSRSVILGQPKPPS
ncbi:hypothetical protein Bbelb_388460 [Branchiostoma belcheri]|nr:hypothetical protein Bbelb_388460 [Branchiostoma belcheri]